MDKEQEIAMLRTQVNRHMDAGKYQLASQYIYLIEAIERHEDEEGEGVCPCNPY